MHKPRLVAKRTKLHAAAESVSDSEVWSMYSATYSVLGDPLAIIRIDADVHIVESIHQGGHIASVGNVARCHRQQIPDLRGEAALAGCHEIVYLGQLSFGRWLQRCRVECCAGACLRLVDLREHETSQPADITADWGGSIRELQVTELVWIVHVPGRAERRCGVERTENR